MGFFGRADYGSNKIEFEVEIGFAHPAWAEVDSLDPGTQRVVADGCRILHDPDRLLARLCAAVGGRQQ